MVLQYCIATAQLKVLEQLTWDSQYTANSCAWVVSLVDTRKYQKWKWYSIHTSIMLHFRFCFSERVELRRKVANVSPNVNVEGRNGTWAYTLSLGAYMGAIDRRTLGHEVTNSKVILLPSLARGWGLWGLSLIMSTMTCTVAPASPQKAVEVLKGENLSKIPAVGEEKVPLQIQAVFDNGHFRSPDVPLTPAVAEVLSSHAPLVLATSSFCHAFAQECEKQYVTLSSLKASARCNANLTAFYSGVDHDRDARDPWKTIELQVEAEADVSQAELQMMAKDVLKKCPTNELLKEHFCVTVSLDIDTTDKDLQRIDQCYDIDIYRVNEMDKCLVDSDQFMSCVYKEDVMELKSDGVVFELSTQETVPVGHVSTNGLFTPVQAFLFGCLCFYMETFTMRMAVQEHAFHTLEGTLKTTMNNGVKDYDDGLDPLAFSMLGGKLHLNVISDAPKPKVEKAFRETQFMAPSYLVLAGRADIAVAVQKVWGRVRDKMVNRWWLGYISSFKELLWYFYTTTVSLWC